MIFQMNLWTCRDSFLEFVQIIHQFYRMEMKHCSFSWRGYSRKQTTLKFVFEFWINDRLVSYHCNCFVQITSSIGDHLILSFSITLIVTVKIEKEHSIFTLLHTGDLRADLLIRPDDQTRSTTDCNPKGHRIWDSEDPKLNKPRDDSACSIPVQSFAGIHWTSFPHGGDISKRWSGSMGKGIGLVVISIQVRSQSEVVAGQSTSSFLPGNTHFFGLGTVQDCLEVWISRIPFTSGSKPHQGTAWGNLSLITLSRVSSSLCMMSMPLPKYRKNQLIGPLQHGSLSGFRVSHWLSDNRNRHDCPESNGQKGTRRCGLKMRCKDEVSWW
jgi:hypothetical protein